jgi:tetratricopeptide (TPR) repeat protein
MKNLLKSTILSLVLVFNMALVAEAQSVDDAGAALNKGIKLSKKENYLAAAMAFEDALNKAQMAGPEAMQIGDNAKKQLPLMYFKDAVATYKAKKYIQAADKFKTASEVARQYDNSTLAEKAAKNVPALYNSIGNSYRKQKHFEEAHKYFDKAIAFKPDYSKAYLGKMLIYKDLNDVTNMVNMADKINAISSSSESAKSANSILQTHFLKQANESFEAKRYGEAKKHIENYKKYGEAEAQGLYLAAMIYNETEEFDKAVSDANKGLKATQDKDLIANLYFVLGNAYAGQNKVNEACNAYTNALSGPNGEAAKYQMEEVLKCQ